MENSLPEYIPERSERHTFCKQIKTFRSRCTDTCSALEVYDDTLYVLLTYLLTYLLLSARVPKCQKIKEGGLDHYDAKRFGRIILPQSESILSRWISFDLRTDSSFSFLMHIYHLRYIA